MLEVNRWIGRQYAFERLTINVVSDAPFYGSEVPPEEKLKKNTKLDLPTDQIDVSCSVEFGSYRQYH
jgi:hypothetical protein